MLPKNVAKFPESAWKLLYYTFAWSLSVWILLLSGKYDYVQRPLIIWKSKSWCIVCAQSVIQYVVEPPLNMVIFLPNTHKNNQWGMRHGVSFEGSNKCDLYSTCGFKLSDLYCTCGLTHCVLMTPCGDADSRQNKIWNLPDWRTILPKFIYDKEGKLAGPTQILWFGTYFEDCADLGQHKLR